jgi:signal transduction histidine kinase
MSISIFPHAKILVIDDEPSNVRLLERILDLFGGVTYRCTTDPREAVPLFAEFQPDLVLTDLHMPHVDGYLLMEQLRQLVPEDSFLPIVVLTADITAETRRRALGSGASDFITKPLDTTEVQLRIRNLLENRFLNLKLEDQVRRRTRELETALEQLRATQEQVVKQERLRALGMMAGGIAHDFNNALTMMLGYGELLLPWVSRVAPQSKEQGYIANIVAAAQDAAHVVSRLRDFYRPTEAGDVRVSIDIGQLCQQAVAFTAPKWNIHARSQGIQIEVKTELAESLHIMGSAPELREVLTNLIFNSVDAMPNGGTITLRTRALPDHVRVEVIDTGIGMTAEERTQCLEPFFTTKGERGTGLGLAVTYGIIQRHGGSIEIESEKGQGTVFSLLLPASTLGVDALQEQASDAVTRALRVLVVDDQEIICELISEHLRADGHEAESVSDAQVALDRALAGGFDVVITDQTMPGMTGEQLGRALKKEKPTLPIILLTGLGEEFKAQGTPEGIDLVVGKPVSSVELRRAIAEVIK